MIDFVTRKFVLALALSALGGLGFAHSSDAAPLYRTARIIAPSYYSHITPTVVSRNGIVAGTALRPDGLTTIVFKYDGTFTDIGTVGAATGATVTGINSKGQIVGGVTGSNGKSAFEYDPASNSLINLTKLSGDPTVTRAAGINEAGHIVLELRDPASNIANAALWDGKNETRVMVSGANAVIPAAINASDEIAGTALFSDNSQATRPFTWAQQKSTDLGLPSGAASGSALDLNDTGQVLVQTVAADGSLASFVNSNGSWSQVASGNVNVETGLDSNGDVAGELPGSPPKAFVWTNGSTVDINSVTSSTIGPVTHVSGLSDTGEIVGYTTLDGIDIPVLVNPTVPIFSMDSSLPISGVAKTVTIMGAGFSSAAVVYWNGTPLTPISITLGKLIVAIPPIFLSRPGSVAITVANPDGTASLPQSIQIIPAPAPELTVLSLSQALAGAPAITITVTGLHFSPDAEVDWNGAPLKTIYSSDSSLVASIPASSLTDAGTAQVDVVNGDGQLSQALPFTISKRPLSLHQFAAGYQLVSLPYGYGLADVSAILDSSTLSLAAWLPDSNQYVVTPTPPATSFVAGRGYWIRFARPTDVVDLGENPAVSTPTTTIDLKAGWNLIGDPLTVPATTAQLTVADNSTGAATTFTDAVLAGLISATIYRYDSASGQFVSNISDPIQPFVGYWIKASHDISLTFLSGG